MEEWQVTFITANLPALIQMTRVNTVVQAILQSEGVLSNDDVCSLEATKKAAGHVTQSAKLYDLLLGRKYAYEKLTKALFETSQSGVAKILLQGFTNQGILTPLTQCGIYIEHDCFENTDILAYGRRFKLKTFFPDVDIKSLQKLFYEILPEHIYYESIIKKNEFELFNNTIPPKPAFYIPRFISNRIKINTDVFQCICPDVFIFKGIDRYELSRLARPNFTASSKDQLECLTSRFIHLDRDGDWTEIYEAATVPVHLISFEPSERSFILEITSGNSEILFKFCSDQDRAYVREEPC